jgi:hypothetical protein
MWQRARASGMAQAGSTRRRGQQLGPRRARGRWQWRPRGGGRYNTCCHAARPEHCDDAVASRCRQKQCGSMLHTAARGSVKRGGGQGKLIWTSVSRGGLELLWRAARSEQGRRAVFNFGEKNSPRVAGIRAGGLG